MTQSDLTTEISGQRHQIAQLSRLVEISVTLNSTLALDRLLQYIIDTAADLLQSDASSILLVDEKTNELYFAGSHGSDPEELKKIPVPLEGSIAGTIFCEDRPLIINEVVHDSRHFRQVADKIKFETRSLIGVPLRIQDKVTGVLEVLNKREGRFDEADQQMLTNIASQAAVAINNARLVEALQNANEKLGVLDKVKSNFIAIASHELRTPLGLILGYASLLKEDAGEESSDLVEAVLRSALRMRALIEAMTNLSLLQDEEAEMTLEVQPLEPILQTVYEEMVELIRTRGQELSLNLPDEAIMVNVDKPKLAMALINLLNNAIRFTADQGQIWLELETRGREAEIKVRDNGIGIPAHQLERIFDQFYQVDDHLTRRHEGMGLGLSIVKAVIEGHNGRVWADSEGPGTGATFTIMLPLAD